MHPRARATLFLALGLALLGALLAYVGPGTIAHALQRASPLHLLLAFASYCTFFVARGLRWRLLLRPSAPAVRLSSTVGTTAIGWLVNSIVPLKGGDVLRAALLARRERIALATSAATVGLERVLDLTAIALAAAMGLLLLPRAATLPPGLERALTIAWLLPVGALAVLAGLIRWREQAVRLAGRILRPLGRPGGALVAFGDTVIAGLAGLASRPALLVRLVPLTLVVVLAQTLVFTFLVLAFLPGATPLVAFAGSAVFLLSFVVSITPGNVGTYEAAFAAVFIAAGFAAETALAAGLLTHIMTTLSVALLGGSAVVALGLGGRRGLPWRAVRTAGGAPP